LNPSALQNKNDVSDMGKFRVFSALGVPYSGKNARWKNCFFAGHGVV
jgi:hypothetical protein